MSLELLYCLLEEIVVVDEYFAVNSNDKKVDAILVNLEVVIENLIDRYLLMDSLFCLKASDLCSYFRIFA